MRSTPSRIRNWRSRTEDTTSSFPSAGRGRSTRRRTMRTMRPRARKVQNTRATETRSWTRTRTRPKRRRKRTRTRTSMRTWRTWTSPPPLPSLATATRRMGRCRKMRAIVQIDHMQFLALQDYATEHRWGVAVLSRDCGT